MRDLLGVGVLLDFFLGNLVLSAIRGVLFLHVHYEQDTGKDECAGNYYANRNFSRTTESIGILDNKQSWIDDRYLGNLRYETNILFTTQVCEKADTLQHWSELVTS